MFRSILPTKAPSINHEFAIIATGVSIIVSVRALRSLAMQRREAKRNLTTTSNHKQYYLDYNGTTPVYAEVLESMTPYFTHHFGNPSSSHFAGRHPKLAVSIARQSILFDLLGMPRPTEEKETKENAEVALADSSIIFTGCGTEADNLAIHLALQKHEHDNQGSTIPHIVTTNVEHPAVANCLAHHEKSGRCTVTYVPVQPDGRVRAADMIAAITSDTILVTLMFANNETGALQPVKKVAEYCRKKQKYGKKILCMTDAAQAVGKVPVTIDQLGDPDFIVLVGHKIGAPKGVACLYVRDGFFQDDSPDSKAAMLIGGGQELGRRGGTENVPYIVGLGTAAHHAAKHLARNQDTMETLRYRLKTRISDALGKDFVHVHGPTSSSDRLPNTLSIGFSGNVHSGKVLYAVRNEVAASAGAACHSSTDGAISSVLQAMIIPTPIARSTIRLSVGPYTSKDDIDGAAAVLCNEIKKQRDLTSEN